MSRVAPAPAAPLPAASVLYTERRAPGRAGGPAGVEQPAGALHAMLQKEVVAEQWEHHDGSSGKLLV